MRKILLHGHIFKNAGTTFDGTLKSTFGTRFLDHREDMAMRKGGVEYLKNELVRNKGIVALSSHCLPSEIPIIKNTKIFVVYFFRHPLERALSVYLFEKRQIANTMGAVNAKKMSFKEYVEWRLTDGVPATIRNFQVRYCSGLLNRNIEPSEQHLSVAVGVINSSLFGLVDDFENSFRHILAFLQLEGIELSNRYSIKNVTPENIGMSMQEKIELIELELGSELFLQLKEKNLMDLALYKFAKQRLKDRIYANQSLL